MHKKFVSLVLFLASALSAGATLADNSGETTRLDALGKIVVNADGTVNRYEITTQGLSPHALDLIDQNIASWRFEPIIHNGSAVEAETTMHLPLIAQEDAQKNLRIALDTPVFGIREVESKTYLKTIPHEALKSRIGAKMIWQLKLSPNGEVLDAHPYQTSLSGDLSSTAKENAIRRSYETEALNVVKQWKFDSVNPDLLSEGEDTVFVSFSMNRASAKHEFISGPISPAPWLSETVLASASALPELKPVDGQPLHSPFKLITHAQ